MSMNEMSYITPEFLLVHIADVLSMISYGLFAEKGDDKPEFYTDKMMSKDKGKEEPMHFSSGEEFEKARQRILSGG